MGYRTYLNLKIPGEPQTIGTFKNMPTEIILIDNYCIGKIYFNELPEELEKVVEDYEHIAPFFIREYTDDGEILVGLLLNICKRIQQEQKDKTENEIAELPGWFATGVDPIVRRLKQALKENLIQTDDWVQFECY